MEETSKNKHLKETDPLLKNETSQKNKKRINLKYVDGCKDVTISVSDEFNCIKPEEKSGQEPKEEKDYDDDATYSKLLSKYPSFRWFILSYSVSHVGEWFTLVGSIATLERVYPDSQTAKSLIFVLRMLPNILFSSIGGALADALDRKHIMVTLDLMGMLSVWLYFLPIVEDKSDDIHTDKQKFLLVLLYIAILVQSTISALYEPARQAIVPMMVPEGNYLKKATTLGGVVWAAMTAIGSLLGGVVVSKLGLSNCFKIDSMTYLLSAVLMMNVRGNWNPAIQGSSNISPSIDCEKNPEIDKEIKQETYTIKYMIESYIVMTKEVYAYMMDGEYKKYASFIFLKFSGCIMSGSSDIMNIDFSHRFDDEEDDSVRLGIIYACCGIACLVGAVVADSLTDMDRPRTLQVACIVSFLLISIGFWGWGIWALKSFHAVVLFAFIRAMGQVVMWIDSTLLIQKFTSPEMLGRVSSIDFVLATIASSFSTLMTGVLQDNFRLSDTGICFLSASLGTCVTAYWFGRYLLSRPID